MKRGDLLRHLRRHGCYLKREVVHISYGAIRRPEQLKLFHDTPRSRTNSPQRFAAASQFLNLADHEEEEQP